MNLPWQNPLPSEEYITHQVVIYFYTGRWVPIMFYPLADAIALSQKAKHLGQELYIFPTNTRPSEFEQWREQTNKQLIQKQGSPNFQVYKLVQAR